MTTNVSLTKRSSESEIKAYFNAILKLAKSNDPYPVNLDEVWLLVYKRRDSAIEALKRDFIENEDFNITPEKTGVGSNKFDYHLTLACLEYFIVKKVRPVFEVYRQVFHKTVGCPILPKKTRPRTKVTNKDLSFIDQGFSKSFTLRGV